MGKRVIHRRRATGRVLNFLMSDKLCRLASNDLVREAVWDSCEIEAV